MMSSVYLLKDPESGNVRYVGCSRDVTARVRQHRNGGPCKAWLRNLKERGASPTVEVIATLPREQALEAEKRAIEKFGKVRPLLNGTPGPSPKPVEAKYSYVFLLRMTPSQRQAIESAAIAEGVSMAAYLREAGLARAKRSRREA